MPQRVTPAEQGIVLDALSAGYGQTLIVDDINLTIPSGKMTVLAGANGSGKSTLIKTVNALEPIQQGDDHAVVESLISPDDHGEAAVLRCLRGRLLDQRRVTEDGRRAAVRNEPPVAKGQRPRRVFQHQVHVMRYDHDGHTVLVDPLEEMHDVLIMAEILPGCRLIQDDQLWIKCQYGCNRHPFQLAEAQH